MFEFSHHHHPYSIPPPFPRYKNSHPMPKNVRTEVPAAEIQSISEGIELLQELEEIIELNENEAHPLRQLIDHLNTDDGTFENLMREGENYNPERPPEQSPIPSANGEVSLDQLQRSMRRMHQEARQNQAYYNNTYSRFLVNDGRLPLHIGAELIAECRRDLRVPKSKFELENPVLMEDAWVWATFNSDLFFEKHIFTSKSTILHYLIEVNDISKIYVAIRVYRKLLETDETRHYDMCNSDGETPFFKTIEKNMLEISELLMGLGVDVNIQSIRYCFNTPLHMACETGNLPAIRLLLKDRTVNVNILNGFGLTPFLLSIRSHGLVRESRVICSAACARLLLRRGARTRFRDMDKRNAMHYAVLSNEPEFVNILRRNIEPSSLQRMCNSKDAHNETPLTLIRFVPKKFRNTMTIQVLICGSYWYSMPTPPPLYSFPYI